MTIKRKSYSNRNVVVSLRKAGKPTTPYKTFILLLLFIGNGWVILFGMNYLFNFLGKNI